MLGVLERDGAEETKDYATRGGSLQGPLRGGRGGGCAVFEPGGML